jgi:hypothetical protein
MTTLVFYGRHSSDWTNALNDKLLPYIQSITTIETWHTYTDKLTDKNIYILPLMETHMIELHNYKISAMMPPLNTIETFMCKKQFFEYVIRCNLTDYVPATFIEADNIPQNKQFIVKPFNLNSGNGMSITSTLNNVNFSKHIIQEYLPGNTEYCAYVIAKDGKFKLCIVYEYVFDTDTYIRNYYKNYIRKNFVILEQEHIDRLELFLLPCLYTGVCNFNFKICDNVVKVFEINPRLGGGLMPQANREDLVKIINCLISIFQ